MNKAQIDGMRLMADALHDQPAKRWKIVTAGGRVMMMDLDEARADDMREAYFPDCDVVEM
jgi:hypothetical protein